MKTASADSIYPVTRPRVAGKPRNEPPATEEEARLRAAGKSIYRLHKDTGRHYGWVNAIVTAKFTKRPEFGVLEDVRRQIEAYEKEAGIDVKPWGQWTGGGE